MINKKTLAFILFSICFFIIYSLFFVPHHSKSSVFPQKIVIEKKQSISLFISNLEQKKIISNSFLFKLFLKLKGVDHQIKHGHYKIQKPLSINELTNLFIHGNIETLSVTFFEGIRSWEIFSTLKHKILLDSNRLDSLLTDADFIKELGLNTSSLEGFLFPETYLFTVNTSEKDALKTMVKQWKKVFYSLPYQQSSLFQQYGLKKIITMASIVEKESSVPYESKIIARVFWNRYKQKWRLGADPTVRYAIKKDTKPLTASDLKVNSPYNTRKFKGLPPTAICNPGKHSILASLFPKKHDFMFFVSKDDGSREHYFSKTNTKHNLLKKKRYQNRLK